MAESLAVDFFVQKYADEKLLLIDARSPKEFAQGHIPGAVNLPLLDDEARRLVGITYKSNGREAAVLKGCDLVGEKFADFIRQAKKQTTEKHLMVYCWRGGMRSSIMSWVLEMGGFKAFLLKGGYKSFRSHVFSILEQPKSVIVISGKTGSGKTEILGELKKKGEQTICLETLACHRGSAFGALGMPPQPRNEMFQNILAMEWRKADENKILFLENESLTVGPIVLPPKIYAAIRNSPAMEIVMEKQQRIKRIVAEYGKFSVDDLIENTEKLLKRLGGAQTGQAIEALRQQDKEKWVDIILYYYDKAYQFGNNSRTNVVIEIPAGEDESAADLAEKIIEQKPKAGLQKIRA